MTLNLCPLISEKLSCLIADFYEDCGFDYGLSVDHVILGYKAEYDSHLEGLDPVPSEWRARQEITFELAEQFLQYRQAKGYQFKPIGVAQGWSPGSYTHAVEVLQRMGYRYIAFGGFVPLKTPDILACLEAANTVRNPDTQFHLLGITRCENVQLFGEYGAVSFDSTSPLRKAFKDDKHNYYTHKGTYSAVRVPQVDANPALLRRIVAGQVRQEHARVLEQACLESLVKYDQGKAALDDTLEILRKYELVYNEASDRSDVYRRVLEDRPWSQCPCDICRRLGIQVIIFRGAERNRRRGFHNLYIFNQQLHGHLKRNQDSASH